MWQWDSNSGEHSKPAVAVVDAVVVITGSGDGSGCNKLTAAVNIGSCAEVAVLALVAVVMAADAIN